MKRYTISYKNGIKRGKQGFEETRATEFVYANNDFEAGCKVARYMDFRGNATIESVEELKPIKVRYTKWTGEQDVVCEAVCYGTLEDAKRQIGGGMNCFDFKLIKA